MLSSLVGLENEQTALLQSEFPNAFRQTNGWLGVTARGLALIAAARGRGLQLLLAVHEHSQYTCPMRSYERWLQQPRSCPKPWLLSSLSCVWAGDVPYWPESALLALFGAQDETHPERLSEPLEAASAPVQHTRGQRTQTDRVYFDYNNEQLDLAAKRTTATTRVVLSPVAAGRVLRRLFARRVLPSTVAFVALECAARQMEELAKRESTWPRDRVAFLLTLVRAGTAALRSMENGDVLNTDNEQVLCALAGELGSALRLRNRQAAQHAINNKATLLSTAALARFEINTHIQHHSDVVTRSLLSAAMGVRLPDSAAQSHASEDSESDGESHQPENLRATRRRHAMSVAGLATASDALLHAADPRYMSPFFSLFARDALSVTGQSLYVCVCVCVVMRVCACRQCSCGHDVVSTWRGRTRLQHSAGGSQAQNQISSTKTTSSSSCARPRHCPACVPCSVLGQHPTPTQEALSSSCTKGIRLLFGHLAGIV